ncbi:hypothetical protein BBB57_22065 [Kosakonia sacchari]|uniref:hypothetical protein n=1 Tax=Kosakonia sacchari TaxID=1158459 RepID=UPI00080743B1|nr:hypothetical protein [Kosakonia sacchari]ANR80697.1 hypothetical protein BBB57_22065 [Kosakonia sacchari]
MKSGKTRFWLYLVLFTIWIIWILFSSRLSHKVYLQAGAPDTLVMLAIAVLVALLTTWCGRKKVIRNKTRLLTFLGLFLFTGMTLWNVPEAWVRYSANEMVHSEVAFSIGHPGPPISKSKHCEAGLRFYDEWLQRPIELCTRDAIVVPGAQKVQLEKRVSARGAVFTHYRFISASGIPQGWWPVSPPSR